MALNSITKSGIKIKLVYKTKNINIGADKTGVGEADK